MKSLGICIDHDGVLLDSVKFGPDRFVKVSATLGLPVTVNTRELAAAAWRLPTDQLITSVWNGFDPSTFIKEWQKYECKDLIPLVPGAYEGLKKLQTTRLSILTNRDRLSTDHQMHHMQHRFEFIITHDDVGFFKPDLRNMDLVIRRYNHLGISRGNIIYVGDTAAVDWVLAQKANIKFYGVTCGASNREDFINHGLKEEFIINTLEDLPAILGI